MADETQNVVLDFKMNGQVDFANTVKDINAIMNTASKEFKAQIAAMDDNATSTERLAAEQQKLQIQAEAASKRTQMLTAQLQAMQEKGQTSGSAFDRLVGKVADAQRVENNLKGALESVNAQMTEHGQKANDAKDKLNGLQSEEGELDQKMKLAVSSAKLETAQLGSSATAADKNEVAHRQLGTQMGIAQEKVANLKQQLQQTETAYGENSTQANNMRIKLNDAETTVANLGNKMETLGQQAGTTYDKLDQIAQNTFADKLQNIGNGLQSAGQGIQSFADKAMDAWTETDDAVDNLTSKTGALGPAADELGEGFERVERSMAGSQVESMDLSNTMAALKSQFDLSGKALETTSEQVAKFSVITGQSGADAVEALHTSMAQFNVTGKQMPAVLDSLAKGAQTSGMHVQDLESAVAAAYPVFSQLHIGLQEGIGIIASWAKGGIDASTALKGMSKASTVYAKENKTLSQGITETFNAIKNAKSPTDALNAGVEAFGTRAAPKMVAAIQSGKVSLDSLKQSAADSGGTVSKTFNQTLDPVNKAQQAQKDFEQTMAKLGGTIQQTLLPVIKSLLPIVQGIGTAFQKAPGPVKALTVAIGAIVVALGLMAPVITAVATVLPMIGAAATAAGGGMALLTGTILPVVGFIAAIIAAITAVVLVIKNWGAIVTWLKGVWGGIASFFSTLWANIKQAFVNGINAITAFLTPAWNVIKAIFTAAITVIAVVIGTEFELIKATITTVMNVIKTIITTVWNAIKGFVMPVVNSIANAVKASWNAIKSVTSTVFNAVRSVASSVWNGIKSAITNAVNGVKSVVTGVWNTIKSATSTAFNAIKSVASSVWGGIKNAIMTPINLARDAVGRAIEAIKGFFNFQISWPHIPMPHFGISPAGWKIGDLLKGKIPHLSVDWNAQGALFTQPTIAGVSGGHLQGFGEAGPEAALPLNDKTFDKMGAAVAAHMPGQGPIYLQVDGQTFAQLMVGYNADANGRQIRLNERGGLA